ncbi:MAG: cytochrome c oxidase assembly protein [Geminicoccales bacterium]
MRALLLTSHSDSVDLLTWQLDIPVMIGILGAAAVYFWTISPGERARYPGGEPVPRWRVACFFLGLLAFAIALLSPLEPLSDDYLFSAHMIQHILLTLVGPPLILTGIPGWLYEATVVGLGRVWMAWRFLTRPLVAFALFNLTFALVHFPGFYNWALQDQNVHILEHVLLWSTAFIGWWPVLAPTAALGALARPLKGLYLLGCTLPGQIVGAILTFSDSIVYDEYEKASRVWGLSPLTDQQIGGLLMWVGVGNFFLAVALITFYRWASVQVEADQRRTDVNRMRRAD